MQNENPLNYVLIDDEKPVNYRELFEKYSYHWKWFILGIALALVAAFMYLRYTPAQYTVATTILIEDENSGGLPSELAAFEDLGLLGSPKKKVETEIGLLKSRSLMESTVQALDINIGFFLKGRVREGEIYNNAFIKVNFVPKNSLLQSLDTLFTIQAQSATQFVLKNSEDTKVGQHNYEDMIQTNFGAISVILNSTESFKSGDEIIVKIKPVKAVAEQLGKRLKVELKYKNASLIELSMDTTIKQKGEDILNELVRQYNENAVEDKSIIGKNTETFINERMRVIEDDLFNADRGIQQFKTSNKLTDITSEASLALETNSELEKKILELNTQIKLANYVMDYVATNTNALIPANLGLGDGSVNSNTQHYNELLLERNRILKGSKTEHPIIVNLDDQLSQLRRSISESLVNLKSSLQISLRDALNEEQKMSSKITSVPKQEREYRDIQRQQQIIETLYLYLLQKREENSIALAITVPNAKVIDKADSSTLPVSPKKPIVYLVAMLLGGLIPFMVLYISFLFDNKVHTTKDVEAVVKAPIIGEIPHSKSAHKIVVNENAQDNIAESFRMLRTNINFMLSGAKTGGQTIFLTSTLADEGKSFISLNLARVLALSSKKVLLIGADVRKPKLNEYLGIKAKKGLTHYLADDTIQVKEVIHSYKEGDFDVLGSGIVPPNPSELLMNGRFEDVMAYGRAHYDYVIVDTAPLKMVTDTLLLSQYADFFLYVIRAEVLDKRLLEIPEKMYAEKRLPNMAIVLNDINFEKGGYGYGYGYGHSYGYGKEPAKKPWWKRF